MKEFTATEHYYALVLIPHGNPRYPETRYWAKEKDFSLKDITHATRFDSITDARRVRTMTQKKYKNAPWFNISENDEMIIAEVSATATVKEVGQ